MSEARQAMGGAEDTGSGGLRLVERPLRGMVTLRGDLGADALAKAVKDAVGCDVPEVRRIAGEGPDGGPAAAWMSPDELLLFCAYDDAGATVATLSEAMGDAHHLAVDVSDARAVFALEGEAAREVLAKGAPVDLARGAFGVGDLRRTRIGQVAVGFWQVSEGPDVFELVCFRSYADHIWRWLVASSREGAMPGVL